jgi:hypothetical protein
MTDPTMAADLTSAADPAVPGEPATVVARDVGPPLGWPAVIGAVVVLAVGGGFAAMVEALLVPLRWGTVIIPLSVPFAIASNAGFPLLVWRLRPIVALAALPFAAWVIVVLVLSQARPEGDVLLPGGTSGITYVVYAFMLAGFVAGVGTLSVLAARNRPVLPAPRRPLPGPAPLRRAARR